MRVYSIYAVLQIVLPHEYISRITEGLSDIWKDQKGIVVLICVCVVLLIISVVFLFKFIYISPPIEIVSSEHTPQTQFQTNSQETIIVDISGAVDRPGVYEMELGSRVQDLIDTAGGFHEDVDVSYVSKHMNRASELADGMKLYVPFLGEEVDQHIEASNTRSDGISINKASSSELESLSGIGPKTAQKIIENRPYSKIEELLTKRILFESTYKSIEEKLSL